MVALAQLDHIRADAADRPDFGFIRPAVEDRNEPGDAAFGQHFIYDIGAAEPRLRPGRGRIIDHDRQRTPG
ncbi:hypothetical protein D1872_278390 [compost metagenome]